MGKNINKNLKKCFLLGAGFDKIFGFPLWSELIDIFAEFINVSTKFEKNICRNKVNIIKNKLNMSPERTLHLLHQVAIEHQIPKSEIDLFVKQTFTLRNYKYNPDVFVKFKSIFQDGFFPAVITTNFSDTLNQLGLEPYHSPAEQRTSGFFPMHGYAHTDDYDKAPPIWLENHYLSQNYYNHNLQTFTSVMNSGEIEELHIFGYSLNDFLVLSKLWSNKHLKKIIYFVHKDDDLWKQLLESSYKNIFNEKVNFESSNSYEGIREILINNMKKANKECEEQNNEFKNLFVIKNSVKEME